MHVADLILVLRAFDYEADVKFQLDLISRSGEKVEQTNKHSVL